MMDKTEAYQSPGDPLGLRSDLVLDSVDTNRSIDADIRGLTEAAGLLTARLCGSRLVDRARLQSAVEQLEDSVVRLNDRISDLFEGLRALLSSAIGGENVYGLEGQLMGLRPLLQRVERQLDEMGAAVHSARDSGLVTSALTPGSVLGAVGHVTKLMQRLDELAEVVGQVQRLRTELGGSGAPTYMFAEPADILRAMGVEVDVNADARTPR